MMLWNSCRWCMRSKSINSIALRICYQFKSFATRRLQQNTEPVNLKNVLKVLDLVSSKTSPSKNHKAGQQLIQDFVQTHLKQRSEVKSSLPKPRNLKSSSFSFEDDHLINVFHLHKFGLRIDCAMFSYAVSVCGYRLNLHCGVQLHCLAVKDGLFNNVYVGSSLISMYSKCGDLSSAKRVFEELPAKNVVSWTAIISGFAQECQVDICFELYQKMRNSYLKPNDYTLTSLVSACIGCGSLRHGETTHSQAILFGLDSFLQVSNALISMYSKCGNISDALSIFETMRVKDIVSWNSMISGYALHGQAWKAIDLFDKMKNLKIKPDSISFLGVLSSCRHVGLVKQGQAYFNSMVENGVNPELGHYSCIVDLLGRAGLVKEAHKFILDMPIKPNAVIWGSLVLSCRLHDNVLIGIEVAENRLILEPSCAATHVQLAKLYAKVGLWDKVRHVWKTMKDLDMRTEPGYSWIEIGNGLYRFIADDTANSGMNEVLLMLDCLMDQMTADNLSKEVDFGMCWLV